MYSVSVQVALKERKCKDVQQRTIYLWFVGYTLSRWHITF